MADEMPVGALVEAATRGDARAWESLVDRYASLVWSVCRRHRLSSEDAADVSQTVWLRLVEQLGALREPQAVAGWLVTTTRRECLRVAAERHRLVPSDLNGELDLPDDAERTATDRKLLQAEREEALLVAFAELPEHCQRLLAMLVSDVPRPYSEIGATLNMPVGSIGPTRGRCLERLRRCPALAAVLADDPVDTRRG